MLTSTPGNPAVRSAVVLVLLCGSTLLSACGGGSGNAGSAASSTGSGTSGGGSSTTGSPALSGDTAIKAAALSGYQSFQGGLNYPLLQVEATLPANSALRPAMVAAMNRRLGRVSPPVAKARKAGSTPPLTLDAALGLYETGFTISGTTLTDQFYSDAAGTQSAGTLTVTYPTGTTITSLGETSASPPFDMTIDANITGGNLPITGSGTITLQDSAGAGEVTGNFTLTNLSVDVTADLKLSDAGDVSGTATITENGQTLSVTGLAGPFTGDIVGQVSVAPQGYTGTATLSIPNATFVLNLNTGSATAIASAVGTALDISYGDGTAESVTSPMTTAPGGNAVAVATTGSIAGTLFTDVGGSGSLLGSDPTLAGVTVTLAGAAGTVTATTGTGGTYSFGSLAPGAYTVSVPGTAGGESIESPDSASVTLASAQAVMNQNFAYAQPATGTGGTATYSMPVNLNSLMIPHAINASGVIVGDSFAGEGFYLTSPTAQLQSIANYQGSAGLPWAINNNGLIVGTTGYVGVVVWSSDTAAAASLNASFAASAWAVNDAGEVVASGTSAPDSNGVEHSMAAYWSSSTAQAAPLNALTGDSTVIATGVNAGGTVVGSSSGSHAGKYQPVFWPNASSTPQALPGGLMTTQLTHFSINASNQIVGSTTVLSDNQDESEAAPVSMYWSSLTAAPVPLPLLPGAACANGYFTGGTTYGYGAVAINASGVIGGSSPDANCSPRAVIWKDGEITDLNSLIPANSGWTLTAVYAISDAGGIVGAGNYNGQQDYFYIGPN